MLIKLFQGWTDNMRNAGVTIDDVIKAEGIYGRIWYFEYTYFLYVTCVA